MPDTRRADPFATALDGRGAGGHRRLDRLWLLRDRDDDGAELARAPRSPRASTPPPTAMQGTPAAAAALATPRAVLPNAVCASMRPSPVMTRSAFASLPPKSVASMTSSTPGRRRERPEAIPDGEQREADAARGAGARCLGLVVDRCVSSQRPRPAGQPPSSSSTWAGVAPFCGPYVAAAPVGPRSGFDTSQATSTSIACATSRIERRGRCARRGHRRRRRPRARASSPRAAVGRRAAADPERRSADRRRRARRS